MMNRRDEREIEFALHIMKRQKLAGKVIRNYRPESKTGTCMETMKGLLMAMC